MVGFFESRTSIAKFASDTNRQGGSIYVPSLETNMYHGVALENASVRLSSHPVNINNIAPPCKVTS